MRNPKYWRDLAYWRWWWRERLNADTRLALVIASAGALVVAGVVSAETLSQEEDSETLTVPVFTSPSAATSEESSVEADAAGPAPLTQTVPLTRTVTDVVTVFETVTRPGDTNVETVRRNGRTIVVRRLISAPAETVTHPIKVLGPVRERVVTNERTDTVVQTHTATRTTDRLVTVTAPAAAETVLRTVTQPSPTVTQTNTQPSPTVTQTNTVTVGPAIVVTVTRPVTVTHEVTVTSEVTVTQEVTVTGDD